jgi:hypothetical protein
MSVVYLVSTTFNNFLKGASQMQAELRVKGYGSNVELITITDSNWNRLTERQQKVISMRYGINGEDRLTLKQVSEKINRLDGSGLVSTTTVRNLEYRALRHLRLRSFSPWGVDVFTEDTRVENLNLSVRTCNCLRNANIQTVKDLISKTEKELLKSKNFGKKSVNEIKDLLDYYGFQLKDQYTVKQLAMLQAIKGLKSAINILERLI